MILVREISKSYARIRAVRGISFAVEPGEIVGLLGPNGAGKSTTMRIITGFLRPDQGSVEIDGFDTHADSLAARQRIGYLPESAPLYPEMSVRGYLDHRARLFSLDRTQRIKAINTALDRCNITDVARRRIGQLSKGYRQRVGLAAAMLHDPKVLILDEPSNGLDPSQIRQTRSLVRELAESRTMIVSSHILPEVERLATRLVVIAGGQVRADDQLDTLLTTRGTRQILAEIKPPTTTTTTTTQSASKLLAAIRGITAIVHADTPDGWLALTLSVDPSAPDPRPEIARRLTASGFTLRELREVRPTLERVFADLIESPATPTPTPSPTTA
ncbi:MAG: ATP-binding cassette domain-containing protein [Planctomycetota bacterium]|nr:ATP-binding cassette domain-containing protein [Planctomycetota bacterium]